MSRLTLTVACTALALALGACGKDDESVTGRDAGDDGATVTTSPTPGAGTSTSTQSDTAAAKDKPSAKDRAKAAAKAKILAASAKDRAKAAAKERARTASTAAVRAASRARAKAASKDQVSIAIRDIKFKPQHVAVKVGQKITWTNRDMAPHNVTAKKGATFASEKLNRNDSFTYTPTKAATIDYVCTIHPRQDGKLLVTK